MKIGLPYGVNGSPERKAYNAARQRLFWSSPGRRAERSVRGKALRQARGDEYKKKHREYARKWRLENAEYNNARKRQFRKRNPVSYLLSEIRVRSRKKNLPFNLDKCDIIIPERCPILGTTLGDGTWANRFSLDRVIPGLGYVKGNVRVISMRANRLKSDATLGELNAIIDYVTSHVTGGVLKLPDDSVQGQNSSGPSAGSSTSGHASDGGLSTEVRPTPEPNR